MKRPRFFNPYGDIRYTKNRLPHWQQGGATYFVTFLLADAIPRNVRDRWSAERAKWLDFHPEPWDKDTEAEYHRRFCGAIERWLDVGYGSCLLRGRGCAEIVGKALRHFDGERVALASFVIMPNHVHAVFIQNSEFPLEKLILSWKTFSARKINKLVRRSGSLWQRDYFDRVVRNEQHFANCIRYIRRNPERARLPKGEYLLYESELAQAIQDKAVQGAAASQPPNGLEAQPFYRAAGKPPLLEG